MKNSDYRLPINYSIKIEMILMGVVGPFEKL
jgi:hypothetical protein